MTYNGGYSDGYAGLNPIPGSTYGGYFTGYGFGGNDPTPPPPPPPAPPPVDPTSPYLPGIPIRVPSPVWTFAAGGWTGLPTVELSHATSRSVTWRLVDSSEASLSMPGLSPQTTAIEEMITDLWVMWNGIPLFRGRFGASSDQLGPDSLSTDFGVADYRGLLDRRFLWEGDTLSYLNQDQSAIGWGLISATQAKSGGGLNIVRGVGQTTGVLRDRSDYVAGDSIAHDLNLLSQVQNGFDWAVNPVPNSKTQTFDIYYPARGVDRGVVLDFGGRVASATRQVDPSTYGNSVRATGADTLAPVRVDGPAGTDPAGRWDLQWSEQSITLATTLAAKAAQALADGQFVQPSWTATLPPETWGGPADIWLGDQVTLAVKAGRLDVVESLRVYEISLTLDENDMDTVTVTLGAPNPALRRSQRIVDRRLSALERR